MKKIIALLLILSTPAYADNAITVHTGDVVTKEFDKGTLLDAPQADKIKDQLIERDQYQKENESLNKSVNLYKANEILYREESSILLDSNVKCTKELNSNRKTTALEIIGYMAAGALLIYGASRITR